jgi:phage shock protein PspC (stress-responsive transcriptional regulator)
MTPVTIVVLSGFIGGLLTGLAFYTGKWMVYKPQDNLHM